MILTSLGKKQATKQLREAGKEFISDFLKAYSSPAIILRSKEPGLCWKASGQVAYATIMEFSGPDAVGEDSPLLFRLRMNNYPPPAVFYHLKSLKVRHKLGLSDNPMIAEDPIMELTALPEEMGKFGGWVTQWLDNYFFNKPRAPEPPTKVLSCEVNHDLTERREDLTELQDWRTREYLWTPGAIEAWNAYLQR